MKINLLQKFLKIKKIKRGKKMRIHFKKNEEELIFGALVVEPTKFLGHFVDKNGKTIFHFETEKHGEAYVNKDMLKQIIERRKITGFPNSAINEAWQFLN